MMHAVLPPHLRAWAPRIVVALPVALGVVLLALWVGPRGLRNVHWQPPAALRPDLSRPGGGVIQEAMQPPNAGQFAATLERPLFSPSRRPPPPKPVEKAAAAPPAPDPLESTRIYGTFAAGGATGIIADVGGKPRRILSGGMLGDWRIVSIADRDITFARGTETRVIKLLRAKPGMQGAGALDTSGGARPANMQWSRRSGSNPAADLGAPR